MNYSKAELSNGLSSKDVINDEHSDTQFFRKLESKDVFLNQNQIKVVQHDKDALLVDSCAGSGKSTCIAARISYLISQRNVDANKVLLITFTKMASKEMLEKAKKFATVSEMEIDKITSGTFHSVFLRFLRESGDNREIYSSDTSRKITIKTILRKLNLDNKSYDPEEILAMISHYKNKTIGLDDFKSKNVAEREFKSIWSEYEQYKDTHRKIDFDDMILNFYKKLLSDGMFLCYIRNKFQYILVDEFQDTSELQYEIIKLIAHPHNNVTAIGDCDQVIFSFSGAKVSNILNFHKDYPNVKTIQLDTNYRSTNTILGLGNAIISKNQGRTNKISLSVKPSDKFPTFLFPFSAEDEANKIVNHIENAVDSGEYSYKDFAILYRNNNNSRAIFEELLTRDIPFVQYSGSDDTFYESGTVKPLLAYLRLSKKSNDLSSISDILPTLLLGKDKMEYIKKAQKERPIKNPIEYVLESGLKPFQKSKVADKIREIERISNLRPIVAIKRLREDYENWLIGEDDKLTTTLNREIIIETLDEFENSTKRFGTIEEFIEFVDKVITNNKIQNNLKKKTVHDSVKLMTIHKSKGLEFPNVFILQFCENTLPFRSALEDCKDIVPNDDNYDGIEEERRLAYVAVTRSMENLFVSVPRILRGKDTEPSRFIVDYIDDVEDKEKTEDELESVFA